MTYAKNVVDINKAIDKAYWENLVAKGAGLAYDKKNGNWGAPIKFKHLTNEEFQREYGNAYDDREDTFGFQGEYEASTPSEEDLHNYNLDSKGSIVL